MGERQILSLDEAAAVLKVGVPTLEELIAQGQLRTVGEGDSAGVRYDDLLIFLRDSQRATTEEGEPPATRLEGGLP
jgi:excisionase family DNA binding protein